jgi:hypothetical protein
VTDLGTCTERGTDVLGGHGLQQQLHEHLAASCWRRTRRAGRDSSRIRIHVWNSGSSKAHGAADQDERPWTVSITFADAIPFTTGGHRHSYTTRSWKSQGQRDQVRTTPLRHGRCRGDRRPEGVRTWFRRILRTRSSTTTYRAPATSCLRADGRWRDGFPRDQESPWTLGARRLRGTADQEERRVRERGVDALNYTEADTGRRPPTVEGRGQRDRDTYDAWCSR